MWESSAYGRGYEAFKSGSPRYSWESPQWQHGWNDAAAHARASAGIAKAKAKGNQP